MAYTLNQGIDNGGLDRVQRSLLVGLPAIVLILTVGALLHGGGVNNPATGGAIVIPIVSTVKTPSGSQSGSSPAGGGSSAGMAANTSAPAAGSSALAFGSLTPAATSGNSGGVVGGRGGGPTGGSGSSTGGGVSLPDCSINQVAANACQVPACSPEVSLSAGQKAILGLDGTCAVVN